MSPGAANDSKRDRFELTRFLEGAASAWGIFQDRFGTVRRRFEVDMNGVWNGGVFELHEQFAYDDGGTESRVWFVTPGEGGKFTATSPDCIGIAHGACGADMIEMSYRFRIRMEMGHMDVDFDDRIYRVTDDAAVNRAIVRKFGVKVGEVSLVFKRHTSAGAAGLGRSAGKPA